PVVVLAVAILFARRPATATYLLSLHDALPISCDDGRLSLRVGRFGAFVGCSNYPDCKFTRQLTVGAEGEEAQGDRVLGTDPETGDRKSTRLNSSHVKTSYAVFCLKNKTKRLRT